jgi:hypothetical protein
VTFNHYTANGNFDTGSYAPGALGFNIADTSSPSDDAGLPSGVRGLAWVGTCNGADAAFQSTINSYIGDRKLYGFYLMDEPDPSSCPPANLKAESDYVHATIPGAITFIIEMNLAADETPSYAGGYNPANSDLDLFGLDPYPCRSDASPAPCDFGEIASSVTAAHAIGIPTSAIVPVYQAFGGYVPGTWVLPTAAQETTILNDWGAVVPSPAFDYAYSWGTQNGDTALSEVAALQSVFLNHNG